MEWKSIALGDEDAMLLLLLVRVQISLFPSFTVYFSEMDCTVELEILGGIRLCFILFSTYQDNSLHFFGDNSSERSHHHHQRACRSTLPTSSPTGSGLRQDPQYIREPRLFIPPSLEHRASLSSLRGLASRRTWSEQCSPCIRSSSMHPLRVFYWNCTRPPRWIHEAKHHGELPRLQI